MENINALYSEYKSLCVESIGFQRAGIDCANFDMNRDKFVYDRLKEIEPLVFAAMTVRTELKFDDWIDRTKFWEKRDDLKFSGWTQVENNMECENFSCNRVKGTSIWAKFPS